MLLQTNNITWRFNYQGSDLLSDEDNLGIAHLIMPGNMAWRFSKECGWNDNVIPHYDLEDMDQISKGSDHECYNSDTQIVLMHWLFNKRRKYTLDYNGLDPFWIFHDSLHAQNDVSEYQVGGIYSTIEKQRHLDGAEYAKQNGVYIKADTVLKLEETWARRWRMREGNSFIRLDREEFRPFIHENELSLVFEDEYYED